MRCVVGGAWCSRTSPPWHLGPCCRRYFAFPCECSDVDADAGAMAQGEYCVLLGLAHEDDAVEWVATLIVESAARTQ